MGDSPTHGNRSQFIQPARFCACKTDQTLFSQPTACALLSHRSAPICLPRPQIAASKWGHGAAAGASPVLSVHPKGIFDCIQFVAHHNLQVIFCPSCFWAMMSCGVRLILHEVHWSVLVSLQLCLANFGTLSNFCLFFLRFFFFAFSFCSISFSQLLLPSLCSACTLRGTLCYDAILLITLWNRTGSSNWSYTVLGMRTLNWANESRRPDLYLWDNPVLCFICLYLLKKCNSCVLGLSARELYDGTGVTETAHPCGFHVGCSNQQFQSAAVQPVLPSLLRSLSLTLILSGSFSIIHLSRSLCSPARIWDCLAADLGMLETGLCNALAIEIIKTTGKATWLPVAACLGMGSVVVPEVPKKSSTSIC